MNTALMLDASGRSNRPGRHWIEVASGAPFLATSPE